ncbi:helix-turn-helix domain-containing protein [Indiicoccus explosivorum]|uniref:helix-turn-helix domain-containing protein n=1 Tax=Indiicoccus explosivorum TaxID=1917864 RepID=UPI000B44BE86|nr:helix-turn-helix transcriptional regulator [Indiicoccus explosivorum]
MDILKDFGMRMKELRLKAGITQEALSIRAELDRSYIGAVERGEKNLSLLNIEKIACALDVDLSYFFGDERFAPRSSSLKRELKRPLDSRFICHADPVSQVIAWKITGPLSEHDVREVARVIKSRTLLLNKGEVRLLIDNQPMMVDGLPFVFSPEVYDVWEELQMWLLPYLSRVAVLCNSRFMKNQLDRLTKRSGIAGISLHIYSPDPARNIREALAFLGIEADPFAAVPGTEPEEAGSV